RRRLLRVAPHAGGPGRRPQRLRPLLDPPDLPGRLWHTRRRGEDRPSAAASRPAEHRPPSEPALAPVRVASAPPQVLRAVVARAPARDLAGAAGPLLHRPALPALPDPLRGGRRGGSARERPHLRLRGDLPVGTALAARALRRRGLRSPPAGDLARAGDPP